jgi:hypothetical protein
MTTHTTKTWFDGEKVVTQEIPESEIYKQEQEPVAWMHKETGLLLRELSKAADWYSNYWQPLYAAPRTAIEQAGKQEPVAWMYVNTDGECEQIEYGLCDFDDPSIQLLYTAPRQWVGLTDEEINEIIGPWGETPIRGYTRRLFDQIEAKLKEKNG